MSKSNATELDMLALLLNAVALPGTYTGNIYIALHTADPGEAGDQTTNECAYTSYARVAVARDNTGAGFTNSGNPRTNAADVVFPTCTGGSETATHFSIGLVASGASQILYSAALSASLAIANLIQPRFATGAISVTEA